MRQILAILLAVLFVTSLTAVAVSAGGGGFHRHGRFGHGFGRGFGGGWGLGWGYPYMGYGYQQPMQVQ
jgi:hypothetical protein